MIEMFKILTKWSLSKLYIIYPCKYERTLSSHKNIHSDTMYKKYKIAEISFLLDSLCGENKPLSRW